MISFVSRSMYATAASSRTGIADIGEQSDEREIRGLGLLDQAAPRCSPEQRRRAPHLWACCGVCRSQHAVYALWSSCRHRIPAVHPPRLFSPTRYLMMPAPGAGSSPFDTRAHTTGTALTTSSRPLSRSQ